MLTIQPASVRNSVKPAFKGFDENSYRQERAFYQDQVNQFDDFINDDHIPRQIKRPFKWFRTLSAAVVDGLAVAWATYTALKYGKSTYNKVASSKYADRASKKATAMKESVNKLFGEAAEFVSKKYNDFKASRLGKKITGWVDAFKKSSFGSKTIEYSKKAYEWGKTFIQGILNKFKKADVAKEATEGTQAAAEKNTFEKVSKGVSAVMGTGSGIAGAYASTVEDKDPEELA